MNIQLATIGSLTMPEVRDRAAQALFVRRHELGLSQEDVANTAGSISQRTVSELERGKYSPDKLTAARAAALARALQWTLFEMQSATGVDFGLADVPIISTTPTISDSLSPRSTALSAGKKYKNIPRAAPEIPDELTQAAELYGHLPMYEGITDMRWKVFMAGASRKRTPTTIEGWLQEFTDLKRMGYDPTEEE